MNELKLYGRFFRVYIKSMMEYRFSFFMDIFVNAFTYIVGFFNIWIILNNFKSIEEWTFHQIMFLYSINLLPFGIAGLFIWAPMVQLEEMVRTGAFDSVLIKPVSPFKYMIFKGFQHTFLGHVIVAMFLFVVSARNVCGSWDGWRLIYLLIILTCSFVIHASMMVIISSLSFWIIKTNTLFEIIIYNVRNFVNYPIDIYNRAIRMFLTFVIPYAFVNYYPIKIMLNDIDGVHNDKYQYLITPIVALLMFSVASVLWKKGVRHYDSTGN